MVMDCAAWSALDRLNRHHSHEDAQQLWSNLLRILGHISIRPPRAVGIAEGPLRRSGRTWRTSRYLRVQPIGLGMIIEYSLAVGTPVPNSTLCSNVVTSGGSGAAVDGRSRRMFRTATSGAR